MPRKSRKNLNTSFFHVITQGINKEYIFETDREKRKYFELLKQHKENFEVKVIAYCIMGNHVHLLIYTNKNINMSLYMKKVNEEYAKYYNFIHERTGYVFRDRFLSEPIYNEKYLYNCIVYIHNNPVKAHITKEPSSYKYCSYNDFIKEKNFIDNEIIKMIFKAEKINVNEYKLMHKKNEYFFMEIEKNEKENVQEIITKYQKENNIDEGIIKQNRAMIEEIVINAKEKTKISNKKLAEMLGISRHRIERILKRKETKKEK